MKWLVSHSHYSFKYSPLILASLNAAELIRNRIIYLLEKFSRDHNIKAVVVILHFLLKIYFILHYECLYVCVYVPGTWKRQKTVLNFLKLKFKLVVIWQVGFGNWTWVLHKSSRWYNKLSHPTFPKFAVTLCF